MSKKISELPAAVLIHDSDLFEVEQGGASKKITKALLSPTPVGETGGNLESGITQLVAGHDYVDVQLSNEQLTADWILTGSSIVNTDDEEFLNITAGDISEKTTTSFRMELQGFPDSNNYFLNWAIIGSLASTATPATLYTLTGPSRGPIDELSSVFTVRIPLGSTLPLPVVIIPDDDGGGGVFTPLFVAISAVSPSATFKYTPDSYGDKTISTSNDSALTDPAPLTYTSQAAMYTLDGPTAGNVGMESTDFTVELPGGSSVVGIVEITPNDASSGGVFTPTSVQVTTGSPSATFTYTPDEAGSVQIGTTNDGGLTNPDNIPFEGVEEEHLLDGLVAYWKLDEASGTRVDSMVGNNLTDHNTVGSTTGKISNCASFLVASTNYLSSASTSDLVLGGTDFTIALWFNASTGLLLAKDSVVNPTREYAIEYDGSSVQFRYSGGDGFVITNATPNVWNYAVITFDVTTGVATIRVNNGTPNTGAPGGFVNFATTEFRIGSRAPGDSFTNGFIDEVGIWKRKLDGTEITALYNAGAGLPFSSFTA